MELNPNKEYRVKTVEKTVVVDGKKGKVLKVCVLADALRQAYQRAKRERRELGWKVQG